MTDWVHPGSVLIVDADSATARPSANRPGTPPLSPPSYSCQIPIMSGLLIVGTNADTPKRIEAALGDDFDLDVVRCATLAEARDHLKDHTPKIVLAGLRLSDGSATELIPATGTTFPIIVLVDPGQERDGANAIRSGVLDYVISTPESLADIRHVVERARREWEQVTERRNAELALRVSEERYALVARGASVGLWEIDYQSNEIYFSTRLRALLGYDDNDPFEIDEQFQAKIHPSDRSRYRKVVKAHLKHRTPYHLELRIKRKDSVYRWFRVVGQAVWDKDGKAARVAGSIEDITARIEAEETATRLGRLLDQSLSEIYVFDGDTYDFLDINQGALDNLQRPLEELRKMTFLDISPGLTRASLDRLLRPLRDGIRERVETHGTHVRADGTQYSTSMAVQLSTYGDQPVFMAIVSDNSEREAAEEERSFLESQLQQAQKMETIGTLAGGIAHDFNNILSPILGYADLALASVGKNEKAHRQIESIIEAAESAKKLVRQILTFSRRSDSDYKPLQLGRVIREAMTMIRASIPATIEVSETISEDSGAVIADQTQLHQILLNLCTNALQAMPERGGKIDVTLKKVELDSYFVAARPALRRGPHFKLSVRDNGTGMSQETLDRVFEPFFTTKAATEGTGLGLSVVHGLVRSHGGDIMVTSKLGVGTEFTIYLPYVDAQTEDAPETVHQDARGTEHVLFVDDAQNIAGMVREMLLYLGYEATVETNSPKALEVFSKDPTAFDIVVTDQTMPEMTGLELATKIQAIRPGLPIVLVSGISETLGDLEKEKAGIKASLMKPLTIAELGGTIRRALDGTKEKSGGQKPGQ